MLRVKNLYFERDDETFFHGLNFHLKAGSLLQVTGANGTGKTTLLRLLAGFLKPAQGSITFSAPCAFLGHKAGVSPRLSVQENLIFTASLYTQPTSVITALLTQFELMPLANRLASTLSAGQKQRLALAGILLSSAKIWLLDEPFTALDKKSAAYLKHLVSEHLAGHGAVVLTTHQENNWPQLSVQSLHLGSKACE